MNAVKDAILNRRSIRKYKTDALSKADIEEIIEAGRYAPSGHNRQAWRFTAITDSAILKELNELVIKGFADLEVSEDTIKELKDAKAKVERLADTYNFAYGAPCLIIVSNLASDPNARASGSCAMENMFIMAQSMGIGSCWVNQLHWLDSNEAIRSRLEELGIPRDHTIVGSGSFGYAETIPAQAPARKEDTFVIIG